jgi:lysozyme
MKKLSQKGIELLAELEGLRLKPYLCTSEVPTIGLGNTFYENGAKVTMQDKSISKEEAYRLFFLIAPKFEKTINENLPSDLTQNQFDALFCFAYNVGQTGFKNSTLLRKIKENPNDVGSITQAFLMWKGKKDILLSRRKKEINRYFL